MSVARIADFDDDVRDADVVFEADGTLEGGRGGAAESAGGSRPWMEEEAKMVAIRDNGFIFDRLV